MVSGALTKIKTNRTPTKGTQVESLGTYWGHVRWDWHQKAWRCQSNYLLCAWNDKLCVPKTSFFNFCSSSALLLCLFFCMNQHHWISVCYFSVLWFKMSLGEQILHVKKKMTCSLFCDFSQSFLLQLLWLWRRPPSESFLLSLANLLDFRTRNVNLLKRVLG